MCGFVFFTSAVNAWHHRYKYKEEDTMTFVVSGLTKRFGNNIAVDNLSFSMDHPGIFGLIGTNGAGKTTTIRMILGILPSDSGTALWNGSKISRESLRFGYMPEERGIYMKNKVGEQLVYFGMLRGMTKKDAEASVRRYLDRMEIPQYYDMTAEKLSKGNQQKIQLIATLVHDPELIFLDEPFSGLDPVNADMLDSILRELVEQGKFIVMSSHQMETVERYCENLVILDKGKTLISGNLRDIKSSYGHTKLILSPDERILPIASSLGIRLAERNANGFLFSISCDDDAKKLITLLLENGVIPEKYEIAEPSLSEIFIEKVGEAR